MTFVVVQNSNNDTMTRRELHQAWGTQKEKLKLKFAALTDTDLLYPEGMETEMITKLALKLGKTKEEVYQIIKAI